MSIITSIIISILHEHEHERGRALRYNDNIPDRMDGPITVFVTVFVKIWQTGNTISELSFSSKKVPVSRQS